MYKGIVVTLALLACGLASGLIQAAGFSSLEERMSQNEFHAAGLEKLSPEELKALNEWLRTHNAVTVVTTSPSGEPVFYPKDSDRSTAGTATPRSRSTTARSGRRPSPALSPAAAPTTPP